MSLFLGKIHFWLFDKIKWFENLEESFKNCKGKKYASRGVDFLCKFKFWRKTPNKP